MSLIRRMLKQRVLYWGTPVSNTEGGFTFAAASELRARWEDRQVEYFDAAGARKLSQSVVYVEADVAVGGFLRLGTEDDLESGQDVSTSPYDIDGAFRIGGFDKLPDIRARRFVRIAYLESATRSGAV